jgi:DNA-binding transcriptional LysR family regulator
VFGRLRQKYPGISINVTPTVAEEGERYRGLRERKFDIYLGRVTQIEEDIHADTLFDDCILIVTRPDGKWARRRKIALSDLADEPWVLPQPNAVVGSAVAEAFRACGVRFPPKGVVWGSPSITCAFLPVGPFIGVIPASLLQFGANLPPLKVLPVGLPVEPWPVGIMTLRNRTLTPVVKLFIDCARDAVKLLAKRKD